MQLLPKQTVPTLGKTTWMLSLHAPLLGAIRYSAFLCKQLNRQNAPKLKELFPELEPYDLVALFPTGYPAEDCEPSPNHFKRNGAAYFTTVL